jgi:hypothetical protein
VNKVKDSNTDTWIKEGERRKERAKDHEQWCKLQEWRRIKPVKCNNCSSESSKTWFRVLVCPADVLPRTVDFCSTDCMLSWWAYGEDGEDGDEA